LVPFLFATGADATYRTANGDTLLHVAASLPSSDILCKLILQCMDIDILSRPGNMTALHTAICASRDNWLMALLRAGASMDVRDGQGRAALHFAAGRPMGLDDIVQPLNAAGANVYTRDRMRARLSIITRLALPDACSWPEPRSRCMTKQVIRCSTISFCVPRLRWWSCYLRPEHPSAV
jgi:Ankyrin repeats (3 copies)